MASGGVENADQIPEHERRPIDHDHIAFSRRCKEPGWEKLDSQLILLADPVRDAVLRWAEVGEGSTSR